MTDAGAQVAWPARFDARAGEVIAVQHAMNFCLKVGPEAFAAVYQNEPALPQVSALDGRWPSKIDSKPCYSNLRKDWRTQIAVCL